MKRIQIVLDKKLLQVTDEVARRTNRSSSAIVCDALWEHLRRLQTRTREQHDRAGYSQRPQIRDESLVWEAEVEWPAE